MVRYHKPYLSISEQIDLLLERGMEISDREKAERYLRHIGYYRLSAYWYSCRETEPNQTGGPPVRQDTFKPSTRFSDVVDLYVFDKRLRLLLLDAIERVEVSLRTAIALEIGAVDPWAHLDPSIYRPKFIKSKGGHQPSDFDKWKVKLANQQRMSKESFVEHFSAKYSTPDLPVWVSVELWDFGMLSKLLSGVHSHHAREISKIYGIGRSNLLPAWIRSINGARNICAHHARLWNRVSSFEVKSTMKADIPLLEHLQDATVDRSRVYAVSVVLQFLMRIINPDSSWSARLKNLVDTYPTTDHFVLGDAGFSELWMEQEIWKETPQTPLVP